MGRLATFVVGGQFGFVTQAKDSEEVKTKLSRLFKNNGFQEISFELDIQRIKEKRHAIHQG